MSLAAPGEGLRLTAGGNEITVKIHPRDGAQDLSMFESVVLAGGQVFPHLHREFEEAFYVLEGELMFLLGDEWKSAAAGTAVHVPRGLVHAFRNVSAVSARVVVIHTPASAINMIEELAGLPADSDPEASAKILARHASEPVRLGAARR